MQTCEDKADRYPESLSPLDAYRPSTLALLSVSRVTRSLLALQEAMF